MDDPNTHAYGEDGPTDAEIGRQWRENSSLEKWFPITAERLVALDAENAALKRDLEYARVGLTKGRTRMREDITRLQAEVEQLRAENARLAREAHAWWTACRDAIGEAERLRGVLLKIEAGEYLHLPTMVRDALGPNHQLSGAQRPD